MILIDGYNLMYVTRFCPPNQGEGALRHAREAMLKFLAQHLDPTEYPAVTVVFDSSRAPRRLPVEMKWRHLQVYFARDHASADDMIELLIRKHSAPQQLTVVSSDHRVQRAAQRRKATTIDSDDWFDALLESSTPTRPKSLLASGSESPTTWEDDEDWLEFFAHVLDELNDDTRPKNKPAVEAARENPFPSDYFDDLKDEFPDELGE